MICKNTYQFLISLKSAWRNNQVYFQTLRTKEVILIAYIFKKLGIITKVDYVNRYMDWFSHVEYRANYFKKWKRRVQTKKLSRLGIQLATNYFSVNNKNVRNFVIYQRANPIFISYFALKKYYSDVSSVFLLSTGHGIITSKEALLLNSGGYLICKIEF